MHPVTTNPLAKNSVEFARLHRQGLLLPNAWDAASARIFEAAGFAAIGTTSAGIAWASGVPDGQRLSLAEMEREVGKIVKVLGIPVNADIEAGYGDTLGAVADSASRMQALGAAGINLEDATGQTAAPLFSLEMQQRRLDTARRHAPTLFLTARTDTYLLESGQSAQERLDETILRGQAYLVAGADLIFVPGLGKSETLLVLSRAFEGRLAVMAGPGRPPASELLSAGIQRVSIGPSAMLRVLGLTTRVAQELRQQGTSSTLAAEALSFEQAQHLFHQG
ncbi:isocitrate lyase/phosphoenolpyruvate mutase family protein [Deinococcus sp. KNUC1210]|uniref:isocitrate lyase/PEP mutase family protein n=1 Tax=Deinococcus sp. KNUC1210 TaxID=2917691 RepID=UPI001EF064A5|nr:isocitrate lyase/phosphoenolpyruvate mutase family protein [Deinococcus sp. KNUC1210]ULH14927.1 isocitrate lyase/phosphoenolpyruvate mutase family protein [Deinococcus sp. KNUC1210]